MSMEAFFRAYLVAFLYWNELTLGCLALLMLHHLAGGRWGFVIQRLLAAGARTVPLMAALFLALIFGIRFLYPWASVDIVEGEELLLAKSLYLNVPFFLLRAAIYFASWFALAFVITRRSYRYDETGDERVLRRADRLSAFGLIVYVLTSTFAAIDWSMSLDPNWFSAVYGWLFAARQVLGGMALAIVALGLVWQREALRPLVTPRIVNDLGNLLLAALLTWAYLAFIQFLVIWYGNIPEEVVWYVERSEGGWRWLIISVAVLQFAVPGVLLLIRNVKRSILLLAAIAGLITITRLASLYWLVMPSLLPRFSLHWLDVALPIGMGGLWLAVFIWQLRRHHLAPLVVPAVSNER